MKTTTSPPARTATVTNRNTWQALRANAGEFPASAVVGNIFKWNAAKDERGVGSQANMVQVEI